MIFDCDGVLVDSEALGIEIESRILVDAGFPVTTDEIADRYIGLTYRAMIEDIERRHGNPVPAEVAARIPNAVLEAFPAHLRAVPGMPDLLDRLTMPRCVASSSDLHRIRLSVDVTGLAHHFPDGHLFSAQMVDRGKPAPDLFLHAAASVGVAAERCVVIEDSPHGVAGAVAAGMQVIGFLGGGHVRATLAARLRDAGASTIARDAAELAALLKEA